MTTAQILILLVLATIYGISLYQLSKRSDDAPVIANLVVFFTTFLTVILLTYANNSFLKEHKCPEYERVENVYKLKEKS